MAEGNLPPSFVNNVNSELARLLREIYNGKQVVTDAKLLKLVGSVLESQATEGFGKTFAQVDWNTPDAEMLTRLTRDTWNFASAKNYQQLRDMTLALRDENGNLRSFTDFKEVAGGINSQFNERWLKTEYNDAIGSATMASKWNTFEKESEVMPYLRYSTVGDERVRTEHEALDGIIRKVSDSFWNTHYPPNGYGCRCDVEQLPGSLAVETETIPDVKIPPMFRTNLAKNGLIFPSGHPYYEGIPANIVHEALATIPKDAAYKTVYSGYYGSVKMHLLHGIKEAGSNIATAKILADNNMNVNLLPILHEGDDKLRETIYGSKDFVPDKNPDALIDKKVFEIKTPGKSSISAIHNAIKRGQTQADNILIYLKEKLEEDIITQAVKGQLNQSLFADKVWVINGSGKPLKYTRKSLGLPPKAKRPTK